MTTMLEKVAEAIARQMAEDENDNIDIARAALEAIREPNEVVAAAGAKVSRAAYEGYGGEAGTDEIFTAMIDAILNEKP